MQRMDYLVQPCGHGGDTIQCQAFGAAVAGKIKGENILALAREISSRQYPDTMLHACSVEKNHRWFFFAENSIAGAAKNTLLI